MKVSIIPPAQRKTFADLNYGEVFVFETSTENGIISALDVRMKVRRLTGALEAVTLATGEILTIASAASIVIPLDKAELTVQSER